MLEYFILGISDTRQISRISVIFPACGAHFVQHVLVAGSVADRTGIIIRSVVSQNVIDEFIGQLRTFSVRRDDHRIAPQVCAFLRQPVGHILIFR